MSERDSLEGLRRLHAEVDERARELARRHAGRLQCGRGCSDCCRDGITVFEVEAALIRADAAELLRDGRPHPSGACAFLSDDGACRIYESRPYVCRTQGLPLRWFDEHDGDLRELRDICPLNADGPPVEDLPPEDCWSIGPFESRLADLQRRRTGDTLPRVALRDLWRS